MAITGPVTLATLTTRPNPRAATCGIAARHTRKAVSRLRANPARHVARLIVSRLPGLGAAPDAEHAGVVDDDVQRAVRRNDLADERRATCASSVRSATWPEARAPDASSSETRSRIRSVVDGDSDGRPELGEQRAAREADTGVRARAGDERDAARQVERRRDHEAISAADGLAEQARVQVDVGEPACRGTSAPCCGTAS